MRIQKILHFVVFATLIIATNCHADVVTDIATAFYQKSITYGTALQNYAEKLFGLCLILDVALMGIKCALNREQIGDTIKQFCMILLFSGFIFSVITHYQEWTQNIIKGLGSIGTSLGGADLALSPFKTGMVIVEAVISQLSATAPMNSLGLLIAAGVSMVCFALMTAQILLIKCEAYIAMNCAVILLGFGGSGLLKEYAINTLRYALSVAFKLFVMGLVLGVGMSFITDFRTSSTKLEDLCVLIGAAVVLLTLVKTLPEICAGIINGSHTSGGSGLTTAAAAVGGAMVGAAAATHGAARFGNTVRDAAKLASLQGKGGLGGTIKNLHAAHQTAQQGRHAHGSHGQRMSAHVKENLDVAKAASNSSPTQDE